MSQIRRIISNKIFVYLISRYGTYALQFIVSMAVAMELGPFYLGVYGFINLIISCLNQIDFGIPHSLNVLLVHNKAKVQICNNLIGNSFVIYGILSTIILVMCVYSFLFGFRFGHKYEIENYCLLMGIIAVFAHFNSLFTTILRVRNKINQLAIFQSLNVFLNLIAVFLFKEERLITALIVCQLLNYLFCFIIAFSEGLFPNFSSINYDIRIQKKIIYKGFYLFLYNSCFYFIVIAIRTIISEYYTVAEFGMFNFSFTIANAIFLLLNSLGVIIFPKIVDLLSSKDFRKIGHTIEQLRVFFVSASHFLIYIALLFYPLIVLLMPEYREALTSMNLIGLAILMNTNSYGYSAFLIAQNREKVAARISIMSLVLSVLIAMILVVVLHVKFSYAILAIMITYLFFSMMAIIESNKIMGSYNFKNMLKILFPIRLFIPYISALSISLLEFEYIIFIPLLLYIILNMSDMRIIINMGKKVINNPNIADV